MISKLWRDRTRNQIILKFQLEKYLIKNTKNTKNNNVLYCFSANDIVWYSDHVIFV